MHTYMQTYTHMIYVMFFVHFDLLLNYLDSIFSEHVFYEKNDVMFIILNDKPFSKLTNITNDQNGIFNLIQHMTLLLRNFTCIKLPNILSSIQSNLLSTRD